MIKDEFDNDVARKVLDYGCEWVKKIIVPDAPLSIAEQITRHEIAEMDHGGLCMDCETWRFPNCSFGK